MAILLPFSFLVALVFIPYTAAFEWDDFTNNLATDLGPLVALFGEQVTKQFLSESLSTWDNIIFAVSPLGILTAVVSAIRVCGSPSLRAFIGRAQEGPGIAEVELLSCTSETTSELWNEGGIARVFGKPQILELVITIGKDEKKTIKLFDHACEQLGEETFNGEVSRENLSWGIERPSKNIQSDSRGHISPNLSLNFGIKRLPKKFTYGAAIFGVALQIGVLLYAGLTAYRFPAHFLVDEKPIETYAFPLTFSGTLFVCFGMFLCAYIIEKQTDEVYYKRKHHVGNRLYWVQPGGQKIGDQVFEAFVGESDCTEYIRSSRTNPETKSQWVGTILWTAVIITMIGFVIQFIGLRAMHSSVTIAQLISTMIMAIIRAGLRSQRMYNNQDILAIPKGNSSLRKNVMGHELDFLALHLENISAIDVSTRWPQSEPL
ncbi:ankyrin repeat-containing protein, partial [Pyrenophora tritici-repentis]